MTSTVLPQSRLPDFIIGGAPKCGTTSLHFILDQNIAVGMPEQEIHYFDADDPITHPEFLHVKDKELHWFDTRQTHNGNLNWYASRFIPFHDRQLIGEDSTTYLFSAVAAERIKALLPDVKLIFVLRDPVRRAYSQYWHLIRSARLSCSFEEALSRHTSIILGSTYAPHLAHYIKVFGREAVHIAVFEDFMANKQAFIDQVTKHIGAPQMPLDDVKTWFNRTYYPTRPVAQWWLNRVGKKFVTNRYRNHMGQETGLRSRMRSKMHYRWFRYVNPIFLKAEHPPTMETETAKYLAQHFSDRNRGLSDMLGRDLSVIWPGFTG